MFAFHLDCYVSHVTPSGFITCGNEPNAFMLCGAYLRWPHVVVIDVLGDYPQIPFPVIKFVLIDVIDNEPGQRASDDVVVQIVARVTYDIAVVGNAPISVQEPKVGFVNTDTRVQIADEFLTGQSPTP